MQVQEVVEIVVHILVQSQMEKEEMRCRTLDLEEVAEVTTLPGELQVMAVLVSSSSHIHPDK
tara:strand:+ start:449 stop:634 length:186 start_codon:yes stop_codon:yes gene_type:complete